MTKYLDKTFAVAVGSERYRDGWERTFGKECPCCKGPLGDDYVETAQGAVCIGCVGCVEQGKYKADD